MRDVVVIKPSEIDIKGIVKIHRKCVSVSNSKKYDPDIISSWLNSISEENVLSQWSDSIWLLLKENDKVVGFAQYSLKDKELFQIQIDPNYQGKGYGKKLYQHIENEFLKNEIEKIYLNSTLNAKEFYLELGFVELDNIFYDRVEIVRMEKRLSR